MCKARPISGPSRVLPQYCPIPYCRRYSHCPGAKHSACACLGPSFGLCRRLLLDRSRGHRGCRGMGSRGRGPRPTRRLRRCASAPGAPAIVERATSASSRCAQTRQRRLLRRHIFCSRGRRVAVIGRCFTGDFRNGSPTCVFGVATDRSAVPRFHATTLICRHVLRAP